VTSVRPPAVAGMFYPGAADALRATVTELLSRGHLDDESAVCPKALIVPHAGYIYSGGVAAEAYAQLRPHRVGFRGLALSSAEAYRTPLGDVPLDAAAARELAELPQVRALDAAHAGEHCIEVQVPFLQAVLDDFVLLPIVVGSADAEEVDAVLEPFWDDDATVFVVSSDLSHYLDYASAQRIDRATCSAIEQLAGERIGDEQACGHDPMKGLLLGAKRHELKPVTLELLNSGDTAGDRRRVVGYGAWAFYPAMARNA